ncbi:Chymotrypsin-like elastase family member 2A [Trichinella britovi]|uniref:Chymotrypsin-like elastase family member 2A n=2 Tax=Trichinella TaxID=6333 RepID=A0A0V1CDJ5_TRIBR|nr:Chymotrypsin-like elastase family member 2A [Trichinella murrelli]KRX64722.1 Chymotrypsin-like elastase family member 2A [Trichinella sp. T9]KRY47334.1 Chymotrypsin-like elastase family member 2A [Trichinella britovi]
MFGRLLLAIFTITSFMQCGFAQNVDCGKAKVEAKSGNGEAAPNSFPWMVYLKINDPAGKTRICAGTLFQRYPEETISTVLSAATCIVEFGTLWEYDVTVIVGGHDIMKNETTQIVTKVKSVNTLNAGNHYFVVSSYQGNVVLLELEDPIPVSENARPICLPEQNEPIPFGKECYVAGWGVHNGKFSNVLRQKVVKPVEYKCCKSENVYVQSMFCAKPTGKAEDGPWLGDGGGPLMCKKDGKWVQYGILSHTDGNPTRADPIIYVKLPTFINYL